MKKNPTTVLLCAILCIAGILYTSCGMFTTSLAKNAQRDQKDVFKNASARELAAFAEGKISANPKTVAAIMDALGTKSPSELKSLSIKEKEAVLNLTLDASIPLKKVADIAQKALTDMKDSAKKKNAAERMVRNLIDSINTFDTTAPTQLLTDPQTMREADPGILANAAVALIIQTAAQKGFETIRNNIGTTAIDFKTQTPEAIVEKMLGAPQANETPEAKKSREALKAAVTAVKLLSGAEVDTPDGKIKRNITADSAKLLGLVSLTDILTSFKKD